MKISGISWLNLGFFKELHRKGAQKSVHQLEWRQTWVWSPVLFLPSIVHLVSKLLPLSEPQFLHL